ncbi:MAG TPA: divergent polysaccharide deacetylase family protein [Paracoccaceae bacterium]|nr:divergent polysaccharide deacetylase family protein [Paracoccaceae bacterium]
MIRGFLLGITYGLVLGLAGLVALAIWGTQPPGSQPPEAPLVEAPEATSQPEATDTVFAAEVETSESTEAAAPSGLVAPLGALDEGAIETDPGMAPAASGVEGAMSDPETETDGGTSIALLAPVAPATIGDSPTAPAEDAAASASTTPAAPPVQPAVAADEIAALPEATEDGAPNLTLAETAPVAPSIQGQPSEPDASSSPPVIDTAPAAPPAPEASQDEPVVDLSPAPEAAPEPEPVPEASEPILPQVGFSGQPATVLPEGTGAVRINRPDAETSDGQTARPALVLTGRALDDFASYAEPSDLPRLSIVFIDDGSMPGGPDVLAASSAPVSVAVDPWFEGAADLAAAYRARDIEVLVRLDLMQGTAPRDVDAALAVAFAAIPEAVGVLLVDSTAGDPAMAELMAFLGAEGRGLVAVPQGLNRSMRAATVSEVPAALIYRELDAEEQDAATIRRLLDQAAFRARQESGVVLLARVRPETLSAMILWSEADRAKQVSLVPVSTVLKGE